MNYVNQWSMPAQLAPGTLSLAVDLPDGSYRLVVTDDARSRFEVLGATVADGTATLDRGLEGTAAQTWPDGSLLYSTLTAGVLTDLLSRLAAAEQSILALQQAVDELPGELAPRLLPAGGDAGAVLTKLSAADYAAGWVSGPLLTQWALLASGALLRAYTGDGPAGTAMALEEGILSRLAASPDGSLLAIALDDGTTLLLDASGTPVTLPLAAAGASFATPAWHPDGDLLAVERYDTHAIQIYSVSGEAISQTISLPEHSGSAQEVSAMGWAGGSFCASAWAGGDATLYVHDGAGDLVATRTASGGGAFLQLVVAGDLLFGVTEGLMRCFDPADGFAAVTPPFFAAQAGVTGLAASPDGRYLAVSVEPYAAASTLYIWDWQESAMVAMDAQTAAILVDQMAWARDGSRLYVTPNGGTAYHLSAGDWSATSLGVSGSIVQTLQLESAPWS